MGVILGAILAPLTNLIIKFSIGYLGYVILVIPLLICIYIITLIIKLIYLFSLQLPNYMFFGLSKFTFDINKKTDLSVASSWYQFLIVSLAIWVLIVLIMWIRFALNTEGEKSISMLKVAILTAFKGVGLLLIIHFLVYGINYVILKIADIVFRGGSSDSISDYFANVMLNAFLPNYTGEPLKGTTQLFAWSTYSNIYDRVDGFIGMGIFMLLMLVFLFLVVKTFISIIFDVITKLLNMLVLFLFFPFVVPWSISDGGKKVAIWKDEYLANLLALSIYVVGIKLLMIFTNIINTFIDSDAFKKEFPVLYGSPEQGLSESYLSSYLGWLKIIPTLLVLTGSVASYKTLSQMMIKFIGGELGTSNNGLGLGRSAGRALGSTYKVGRGLAFAKGAGGAGAVAGGAVAGGAVAGGAVAGLASAAMKKHPLGFATNLAKKLMNNKTMQKLSNSKFGDFVKNSANSKLGNTIKTGVKLMSGFSLLKGAAKVFDTVQKGKE
ncbi:Mbov_0396 family ICE element transmembrane protein [Mycoplasma sp. 394]